jgi:hypothetical protein
MNKNASTNPAKGEPVRAVKSDPKPKAAKGRSAPDKDLNHAKLLLKIEYLKRSKLYREKYEDLKSKYLEPKTPKDKKISMLKLFFKVNKENAPVPEFESWVETQEKREEEYRKKNSIMGRDVSEISPSIFLRIIVDNFLIKEGGRFPSIDELMFPSESEFSGLFENSFFLHFFMENGTQEEYDAILKKVAEILKPKIAKKRFMEDELKRYLRVYDLREKGMKWKDIFLEIYPNLKERDCTPNALRALHMDKAKAEKAIKRLENNEFFWWS